MSSSNAGIREVRVWDFPTRLFHWTLAVLIVVAWLTGEEEGAAAIHRFAGEAIAGLIVFRVIWGFVGGEHARFSDFAAGPRLISGHVKNVLSGKPERHLGHNPLGGVAVFLLLIVTALVVATGLFSGDEGFAGPFAGMWGLELSELHEGLFRVLQALVVIHLIGVAVESALTKDRLTPAMVTGRKKRRADEAGADAREAPAIVLLAAALVGFATSALLMSLPASQVSNGDDAHQEEMEHEDED